MYFPAAGIEVEIWIPPLVAFVISFFTSMGGVSGAFLLLPFQMTFLGYVNPSVSATNQLYNIVSIPSGVYKYWKEGRLVWPLTAVVVAGTLPGVFAGAFIRVLYLPDPRHFKFFAGFVLLYIGGRMLRDLINKKNAPKNSSEERFQKLVKDYQQTGNKDLPRVEINRFNHQRLGYSFYGEKYDISFWWIFLLSLLVGIIGGIYGIGGGAIVAPFFVSVFGLPVYTVAGAALMGTFVTSVAGVIFYQLLAYLYPGMSISPDWMLGLLFGLGGMLGMYMGARFQKYVPARLIKWMLAATIVFTAIKYLLNFLS